MVISGFLFCLLFATFLSSVPSCSVSPTVFKLSSFRWACPPLVASGYIHQACPQEPLVTSGLPFWHPTPCQLLFCWPLCHHGSSSLSTHSSSGFLPSLASGAPFYWPLFSCLPYFSRWFLLLYQLSCSPLLKTRGFNFLSHILLLINFLFPRRALKQ